MEACHLVNLTTAGIITTGPRITWEAGYFEGPLPCCVKPELMP